jgi:putative ABC transport system permease protein
MLKHYFTIATRNLGKQKILTAINIFSLSIGIACFSLILLYAVNEFKFDRFHANAENIYRVYRWSLPMASEEPSGDVYLPMPLGPAFKDELPGVKNFVRMEEGWKEHLIKSEGKIYQADSVLLILKYSRYSVSLLTMEMPVQLYRISKM